MRQRTASTGSSVSSAIVMLIFCSLVVECLIGPIQGASVTTQRTGEIPARKPAAVEHLKYAPGYKLAELANRRIGESSGLAASRLRDGVFWTHHDSCDRARIYAFDKTGRDLATVLVSGPAARDWEDIALFTISGESFLLIGDIGDNDRNRRQCVLYLLKEPVITTKITPKSRATRGTRASVASVARSIKFSYEKAILC